MSARKATAKGHAPAAADAMAKARRIREAEIAGSMAAADLSRAAVAPGLTLTAATRRAHLDELAVAMLESGKLQAIADALDVAAEASCSSETVGRLDDARSWALSMIGRARAVATLKGGAR